ncbi:hypothetical protein pneo_cds_367 [Pandoravirus neocaledonia]|uniref:Uncharacterized protein n=1 Tax=Pandoravirus neocaledonia TaxID=2107708 RepID=A0A2U7UC05_9VIRU|nr:hypothetical protein pneo_cds_367 [Pandoravirus neocaledonia]AVK75974.1 hypothetical protein pneo_cds_367 [Pandoravirus neocaledonia]
MTTTGSTPSRPTCWWPGSLSTTAWLCGPRRAWTHLKIEWVYCLAHVINLCVRLTLKKTPGIKDVVKAAKAVCRTFKASAIARRALEDRQADLGLPKRPLKLDNKTRWGSTYEMLRRLTASRPAVSACLGTLHGLRKPVADDLTSAQWSLIKKIADVLEPFQDATEFLSHEKHPTMGAVMPIIMGAIPSTSRSCPPTVRRSRPLRRTCRRTSTSAGT